MTKTTILIVEDEAIVAVDLAGRLERLGYEIVGIAAQGQEAVALARHLHPQLVLMDIQLEGLLDGIETAAAIRRHYDVPVIYLTAHSDPGTLARAKLTGPFGYILKPLEDRELATQIELALYKHRAERQLREQREWLRVTLTSIGDAVIATDADGRIAFVNPAAESLTGWSMAEAAGKPAGEVFRIIHEHTRAAVEDPVHKVLKAGKRVGLANHTRLLRKDGTEVSIDDSAAPIRDEKGHIQGVVLVFRDITGQKRAQAALERSNRELEQFAYVASHDLQEPLRSIVGFLQLLQRRYGDQIDEKGRHFIEQSVKAGYRMQSLIRDLLTLSRVDTEGAVFEPTDLNPIVKNILDNLQSIIKEKNADIGCAELPNLPIDASQIQSLFQNLIMNAVKFNQSPKPMIAIGCQEHDNFYHFFVKDNGIGVSFEFRERIFVVFQRLHTDREYPGTGLGLALCKKIVQRHGGSIWVESQPGQGSTFYFTLPKNR
jgi:two-component system cell cycle sensor histidine kinase/response regulator CckA